MFCDECGSLMKNHQCSYCNGVDDYGEKHESTESEWDKKEIKEDKGRAVIYSIRDIRKLRTNK